MKNYFTTIVCFFWITLVSGQGNEPLKQNMIFRIDSLGNALIEVSSKLSASQWQQWENSYGGKNISLFRRDISRTMNQFYLYDFDYKADEMERNFKISFKAKGVARYLGNNEWVAEMGMKDPDFSKLDNNSFLVTTSQNEGGLLIQLNNTVCFPKKASDVKEDTDEFGYATFTYNLKPVSSGFPLFLVLGLLFLAAGTGSALWMKFNPGSRRVS